MCKPQEDGTDRVYYSSPDDDDDTSDASQSDSDSDFVPDSETDTAPRNQCRDISSLSSGLSGVSLKKIFLSNSERSKNECRSFRNGYKTVVFFQMVLFVKPFNYPCYSCYRVMGRFLS